MIFCHERQNRVHERSLLKYTRKALQNIIYVILYLQNRQKPIFLFLFLFLSQTIDGTDFRREDNTVDSLYDIVSPTWKAWCAMFLFFPSSFPIYEYEATLQNHSASKKKLFLLQKDKNSFCSNLNRFWWWVLNTTTNQFSPNFIVGGRLERERRWERKKEKERPIFLIVHDFRDFRGPGMHHSRVHIEATLPPRRGVASCVQGHESR